MSCTQGLEDNAVYRKYRLLGFIILHSTAHMANYKHKESGDHYVPSNVLVGKGYCADPATISGYLDIPEYGGTFEGIISWTLLNFKEMINATLKRFGL